MLDLEMQTEAMETLASELNEGSWHIANDFLVLIGPNNIPTYLTETSLVFTRQRYKSLYRTPAGEIFFVCTARQIDYKEGKFDPRQYLQRGEEDFYVSLGNSETIFLWRCVDLPQVTA